MTFMQAGTKSIIGGRCSNREMSLQIVAAATAHFASTTEPFSCSGICLQKSRLEALTPLVTVVTANLLQIWQLQKREAALLPQNHFAATKLIPVFFLKGEVVAAKCKSTTAQRRSCRLNRALYLRKQVTAASTHELWQAQRSANDTHEQLSHIYYIYY